MDDRDDREDTGDDAATATEPTANLSPVEIEDLRSLHAAAHAVVAVRLGLDLREVTLADPDSFVVVGASPADGAAVVAAGIAEAEFQAEDSDHRARFARALAEPDIATLVALGFPPGSAAGDDVIQRARDWVGVSRGAIAAIAAVDCDRIDGEHVRKVIDLMETPWSEGDGVADEPLIDVSGWRR